MRLRSTRTARTAGLTAAVTAAALALVAPPAVGRDAPAGDLAGGGTAVLAADDAAGRSRDGSYGWGGPAATSTPYTNPVTEGEADTYADPAVIRGKDGYWYAFGTTDPLFEGEGTRHLLPISRSTDLVTWDYVQDAFTEDTLPSWADTAVNASLWAPDIRYVDGEYRLYYVVTDTTLFPETGDNAIGVATAPTPLGPWTDSGDPVVDPRPAPGGGFLWTFDPHHVTAPDGTEHLFYGSYFGGLWVTELTEDGTEATGDATQVAIDNKFEGSYVVFRDGYWYLFASTANCCAGPTTGYSVHVGRSESLEGPYVDRQGVELLDSRAGGTPVLYQNGNEWIGAGHNAVVTDLAGQDWIVYHAISREDPYLDGTSGINERPMLVDRLDWVDGWPVVNGGYGPSDTTTEGPVTGGRAVTTFDEGLRPFHRSGPWTTGTEEDAGRFAVSRNNGTLTTRFAVTGDVRVEGDLRLAEEGSSSPYGLVAGYEPGRDVVVALVDPAAGELTVEVLHRGRVTASASAPLPEDYVHTAWHSVVLEVGDGVAYAEVSHARLGDPLAAVTLELPRGTRTAGAAGAYAGGPGVHVDNLSAVPLDDGTTALRPAPTVGELLDGDEFEGDVLGDGWTAVRDPAVQVADGSLVWDVEARDLFGGSNSAGLLLRDAPDGDWTAETQVTIDLGEDVIRNYQQAGLIAYVSDDDFARLSHVAIWNTRQTEFGREIPYAGGTSYGGTIIGPPAATTWLRLVKTTDAAGEQEIQAATSTDGETWVLGGVWTFAADADVRIGLVAHGAAAGEDPATAEFEYLRVYETVTGPS